MSTQQPIRGRFFCGQCERQVGFHTWESLKTHIVIAHQGEGTCDYCGHSGVMNLASDLYSTDITSRWCPDEEACDARAQRNLDRFPDWEVTSWSQIPWSERTYAR